MTDQALNEKPDVGDITGIGKAVLVIGQAKGILYDIQHGADRMGDDKVLAVAGVVVLGVDEVERDIARLVQRHLHLQLAAHELDCVLAHLKFPGVELLHVQRVEVLQDNAVPDALGGKGKMVGQGQIDMIHQLHVVVLHSIVDDRLGHLKIDAVCLGGQPDDPARKLPILEHKDLIDLLGRELVADGFLEADALAHQDDLLSLIVECQHKGVVQHFDDTHGLINTPRWS